MSGALRLARRWVVLAAAALAAACTPAPEPIAYGHDDCAYCRMVISDPRYGAELVTTTGKVQRFDSIECLASYFLQARARGTVRSVWVSDYERPGSFIRAEDARYQRADGSASPMGKGLRALAPGTASATLAWSDVLRLVEGEGMRQGIAPPVAPAVQGTSGAPTLDVRPEGPLRTITAALALARPGARIVVHAGVYREPTIIVRTPVQIVGEGFPELDGEGQRQIMVVAAPNVTVRGLHLRNVGTSFIEDRSAIKVVETSGCTIEGNRIDDAFFGIYLARVSGCRIANNHLRAVMHGESASGNGIHLWTADHVTITDNDVSGYRDGIYFEFVHDSEVRGNRSEGNLRYGLHFMYSDQCAYRANTFRRNGAGVAVMYTRHVVMEGNRFEENRGSAAYGLLLKEISDVRLARNRFYRNTTGLFADGTTRLVAEDNEFTENGWALRLDANAQEGRVARNDFTGNTFDVATNGDQGSTTFDANYFDSYHGHDLDRDGTGDVPHRPVRLFSVVVERSRPALVLLRSVFVQVLDAAERLMPALTPETLVDHRPAMRARHPVGAT